MKFSKTKTIQAVTFISWQPYCSRSDNIAREFGGQSYKVYYDSFGSRYSTILFKYSLQFFKTLFLLFRDRPDVVFVMSPPVFATIPVFLYCFILKKRYIIDAHTGAFDDSMWHKVKFLQKFFCHNALLTTVTNEDIASDLRTWGCRYNIIPDVPIKVNKINKPDLPRGFVITLVNTFSKDEPLENFLRATRSFKDVIFFITGKINKSDRRQVLTQNKNVIFTDYLPDQDYYGLLSASDLVAVLTTRDKTMQRGAYEAIYLDKPIITSDWPVLQKNFSIGAVFVDNSVAGIENGIKTAIDNLEILKEEAIVLKKKKKKIWRKNLDDILSIINHSSI